MTQNAVLAEEFDNHRRYLTVVAYRMLGSYADAEDAVQESWLRLSRVDADGIDDLRSWLTRVVSRICLDQLRARTRSAEHPLEVLPDVEAEPERSDPLLRADSADRIGYALMLVLEQLTPDERLAYVLHDVFGLSFEEIADIVDRTPQSARKLASRARRRVRGTDLSAPQSGTMRAQRRAVVEAFLAAARDGDFAGLVSVLHPDVEFRVDQGEAGLRIVRGAESVAANAAEFHRFAGGYSFGIVEVADGFAVLASEADVPSSMLFFTTTGEQITVMESRSIG